MLAFAEHHSRSISSRGAYSASEVLLGRAGEADEIAGRLEFLDRLFELILEQAGIGDADPVHAARPAGPRTIDDLRAAAVEETRDVGDARLRRKAHQRVGTDFE